MDVTKLKRNAKKVHSSLRKLPDGTVVATAPCEIHIPSRFIEVELAAIGNIVEFISIYAIVAGDTYGISTTNAKVRSKPSDIKNITVDSVEYTVFIYTPGDIVFVSSEVVSVDTLIFNIWSEFVDKGRTPWYVDKDDLLELFVTAKSHAGANLGADNAILEMITSVRLRNAKDRTEHLRYTLNRDKKVEEIVIGLRNIQLTADTTSAKIGGSYAEIGLSSALLSQSDESEGLEKILLQ